MGLGRVGTGKKEEKLDKVGREMCGVGSPQGLPGAPLP